MVWLYFYHHFKMIHMTGLRTSTRGTNKFVDCGGPAKVRFVPGVHLPHCERTNLCGVRVAQAAQRYCNKASAYKQYDVQIVRVQEEGGRETPLPLSLLLHTGTPLHPSHTPLTPAHTFHTSA